MLVLSGFGVGAAYTATASSKMALKNCVLLQDAFYCLLKRQSRALLISLSCGSRVLMMMMMMMGTETKLAN